MIELLKAFRGLHVVFPDFGGPMMLSLIGTTGLEMFWVRYNMGFLVNSSLASGVDRK